MIIGTITIHRDFHIWFAECPFMRETKTKILDGKATL